VRQAPHLLLRDSGQGEDAKQWWQRAAELGSTKAMLGLAAVAGTDAPEEARGWYERAATLGNVQAMGELPRLR
jgi:hypothetical protein